MADLQLRLLRYGSTPMGSFGELSVVGAVGRLAYTCELPWRDNRSEVSCIPAGSYALRRRRYYAGGYDAVEVVAVPGRTNILFHKGNKASEIRGCVLVGSTLGVLGREWAVLGSAAAFERLMALVRSAESMRLEVVWAGAPPPVAE